jgi:hypothetical protein
VKLEQYCGDASKHYTIAVLHCNTLFFKEIRILTDCPDIWNHEPSSVAGRRGWRQTARCVLLVVYSLNQPLIRDLWLMAWLVRG